MYTRSSSKDGKAKLLNVFGGKKNIGHKHVTG